VIAHLPLEKIPARAAAASYPTFSTASTQIGRSIEACDLNQFTDLLSWWQRLRAQLKESGTAMLGLRHGLNFLVDYDPLWELAFLEERRRIAGALGAVAKGIEHYGSTAVPGMRAKPILDILVGVSPLDDWAKCRSPLEALGYDYAANAGVPGHHIFGRGRNSTERTHLVHVVEFLGEAWCPNLALRDALRRDASLRARYIEVKEKAVAAAPRGRVEYNEIKGPFLADVKANLNPQPPAAPPVDKADF
jgi:GrpB-like predicted nucleotidyltransferase (UPF0157 family)